MKNSVKLAVFGLFVLFSFGTTKIYAESKPAITVSPFIQDVTIQSTEATKDLSVSVTNNSDSSKTLSLSVLDFGSLNDSGGLVFAGTNSADLVNKYGLSSWIRLNVDKVTLKPGQSTNVVGTIINDESLRPGGHYAAIVVSSDTIEQAKDNKIAVVQKLSSLIFAKKAGGEKYDLKLDTLSTAKSILHLPKTIELRFTNPGNVHAIPRGVVQVLSPSGKVLSQGIINEDSSFILPEKSRKMIVNLRTVGSSGLWPALYRIKVNYRYDGIEQFAHKDQFIYFINLPGFALLAMPIILLVVTLVIIRQKYKKYSIKSRNKNDAKTTTVRHSVASKNYRGGNG